MSTDLVLLRHLSKHKNCTISENFSMKSSLPRPNGSASYVSEILYSTADLLVHAIESHKKHSTPLTYTKTPISLRHPLSKKSISSKIRF